MKLDEILKEPNNLISLKDEILKLSREKNAYLNLTYQQLLSFTIEKLILFNKTVKKFKLWLKVNNKKKKEH